MAVLDVITHVDGQPVSTSQQLLSIIGLRIGSPVTMTVKRNVALSMDWDGSIKKWDTIEQIFEVIPAELDTFMHGQIQKRKETGV